MADQTMATYQTGPSNSLWQLTENVYLFFSSNPTGHENFIQLGLHYNYQVFETITTALSRSMWALFIWIPIFCTIRMRLYPVRGRTLEGQIWEVVWQVFLACCDALVMAIATDAYATGQPFEVLKAGLMVIWYVVMYGVIAGAPARRQFV